MYLQTLLKDLDSFTITKNVKLCFDFEPDVVDSQVRLV